MGYSKSYLAQFKGQKVTFKVVTSFPDLKVQFVDSFGDYKVKIFMFEKICPNKKQKHADPEDQLRHVVLEHIYFGTLFFHLMPHYFELKHSCL